jgi:hypothetical protein
MGATSLGFDVEDQSPGPHRLTVLAAGVGPLGRDALFGPCQLPQVCGFGDALKFANSNRVEPVEALAILDNFPCCYD